MNTNQQIKTAGYFRVSLRYFEEFRPRLICVPKADVLDSWTWIGYHIFTGLETALSNQSNEIVLEYKLSWDKFIPATADVALEALRGGLIIRIGHDTHAKPKYFAASEARVGRAMPRAKGGLETVFCQDIYELPDIHGPDAKTITGFRTPDLRVTDIEHQLNISGTEIMVENYAVRTVSKDSQ